MPAVARTATWKLATARLEFSRDRRVATLLQFVAVAALMMAVGAIGSQLYAATRAPTAARLSKENAALRADIARLTTELAVEHSTRAALEREVARMNGQATALRGQLDFFKQQNGRSAGAE